MRFCFCCIAAKFGSMWIWAFGFLDFLLSLFACVWFLVELFFCCHPGGRWGYLLSFCVPFHLSSCWHLHFCVLHMRFCFCCLPAKFSCICMFFGGIVCFLALMYNMFCGLLILLSVLFNWLFVTFIYLLRLMQLFLVLSVCWCFTCVVSLLCFSCRFIHSSLCGFVFCIWGFAFVPNRFFVLFFM